MTYCKVRGRGIFTQTGSVISNIGVTGGHQLSLSGFYSLQEEFKGVDILEMVNDHQEYKVISTTLWFGDENSAEYKQNSNQLV